MALFLYTFFTLKTHFYWPFERGFFCYHFYRERMCFDMSEEQRLISIGFSEDASAEICSGLRKLGYDLEDFVRSRESLYHRACAEIVKEAMD